jgi:general secretion pathway protein E
MMAVPGTVVTEVVEVVPVATDSVTDVMAEAMADALDPQALLADGPDAVLLVEEPVGPAALPYAFAKDNGVLLRRVASGDECVHRATVPLAALLEVQRVAQPGTPFVEVSDDAFDAALRAFYRDSASEAADFAAASDTDLAALADSAALVDDLLDQRDDSPVIRLINALLLEAVKEGASDIHVETQERRLVVRFRVDGVLRDMIEPKRALAPLLVSRIKVMARLDIAEKRVPQDGRVTLRVGGYDIDARVSTIPTQYGERVVLRLLDRGRPSSTWSSSAWRRPTASASPDCWSGRTASCSSPGRPVRARRPRSMRR